MRAIIKFLLILEFVVAFFPVIYIWILSLIILPASIMLILSGGDGGLVPVIATILGSLGFWGITQLLIKILNPELPISKPSHIAIYLIAGILALIIGAIIMQATDFTSLVMFLLPIIVTLHFVYLKREYFGPVANKRFKKVDK